MLTTEVVRKQGVMATTLHEMIALERLVQRIFVSARAGTGRLSSILAFALAPTCSFLCWELSISSAPP